MILGRRRGFVRWDGSRLPTSWSSFAELGTLVERAPFGDNRLVWTHDGIWHRLTGPHLSITVLEADPPVFDLSVDVEVTMDGRRYSASFFTPEQVRECLDRWRVTGESLPGDLFEVPDGVLVGTLSLDAIEAVVSHHVADQGGMRAPFARLDDV